MARSAARSLNAVRDPDCCALGGAVALERRAVDGCGPPVCVTIVVVIAIAAAMAASGNTRVSDAVLDRRRLVTRGRAGSDDHERVAID
jgi:hypothetical protein